MTPKRLQDYEINASQSSQVMESQFEHKHDASDVENHHIIPSSQSQIQFTARKRKRVESFQEQKDEKEIEMMSQFAEEHAPSQLDAAERNLLIADVTRLALFMHSKKFPLRWTQIRKNVLKNRRFQMSKLMDEVNSRLKTVFGYELYPIDNLSASSISHQGKSVANGSKVKSGGSKAWILRNKSTNPLDIDDMNATNRKDAPTRGLVMVILLMIHLSRGLISEEALWRHLETLGISRHRLHPYFGHIEEYIKKLCKQLYIKRIREQVDNASIQDDIQTRYIYRWGVRAWVEVSQADIFRFGSKEIMNIENPDPAVVKHLLMRDTNRSLGHRTIENYVQQRRQGSNSNG